MTEAKAKKKEIGGDACSRSLYEEITDKIIAELEAGRAPWVKPWRSDGAGLSVGLPRSAATGRSYTGINILLLWGAAIERGHVTQGWLTYRQARTLGGHVRKGERGSTIVYADRFVPAAERERARAAGSLSPDLLTRHENPVPPLPPKHRRCRRPQEAAVSGRFLRAGGVVPGHRTGRSVPISRTDMPTRCSTRCRSGSSRSPATASTRTSSTRPVGSGSPSGGPDEGQVPDAISPGEYRADVVGTVAANDAREAAAPDFFDVDRTQCAMGAPGRLIADLRDP